MAWLATTGTVTDTIHASDKFAGFLAYTGKKLKDETHSSGEEVLDILRLGKDFDFPLDREWRFEKIQFSLLPPTFLKYPSYKAR